MSETWLQEYIFLAFRLHRAVETNYGSPFVEDYWGPEALQKLVEAEPETVPADLVRQAMALADAFPVQGFAPNRVAYLDKHVRAMETLARKLCGETFTLAEEAKRSLDIHPTWTPEAQFEQAHAASRRQSFFLRCFFETSPARPAPGADVWERPKIGATLVTGARQSCCLPSFLNRTMDALTIGGKRLA
jgi:hypothetical protein